MSISATGSRIGSPDVEIIGTGAIVSARTLGRVLRFALATTLALLVTHAIVLLQHEYAHSTTAWVLHANASPGAGGGRGNAAGFMTNPLAIIYGHLDLPNILLQQDMDEGVDYKAMFKAGRGFGAAMVALAGWMSNFVFYLICAGILKRYLLRLRPAGLLFLLWVALMECANLWSYAPVRIITPLYDMGNIARGLGVSSWTLFPFLVLPTVLVAWHFFGVLTPRVLACACGDDVLRRAFATAIACFIYFGFFGAASLFTDKFGEISTVISILSVFLFLPAVLIMTLAQIPLRRSVSAS